MGGLEQIHQSIELRKDDDYSRQVNWDMIQEHEDSDSSSSMASSSSLSDGETEDASSSSSSSSSSSKGPLFQLSELMNQLPIRTGLSKHYKGKSQSFTSMANVRNLEDLAKKVSPYASSYQRMKSCKSYAGLYGHSKFGPKAIITKKSSRGSFLSSMCSKGSNIVG